MYQFEGFDNARVSYETFLKVAEPWDFPQWTGAVKGWLLGKPGQYLRLEDDYDLDHYRLAAYNGWTGPRTGRGLPAPQSSSPASPTAT